jgi:hypothetical protein
MTIAHLAFSQTAAKPAKTSDPIPQAIEIGKAGAAHRRSNVYLAMAPWK